MSTCFCRGRVARPCLKLCHPIRFLLTLERGVPRRPFVGIMALIPFFGVGFLATTHVMAYQLLLRQQAAPLNHRYNRLNPQESQ